MSSAYECLAPLQETCLHVGSTGPWNGETSWLPSNLGGGAQTFALEEDGPREPSSALSPRGQQAGRAPGPSEYRRGLNAAPTSLPAPKLRESPWGAEKEKRQQLAPRQRDGLRSDGQRCPGFGREGRWAGCAGPPRALLIPHGRPTSPTSFPGTSSLAPRSSLSKLLRGRRLASTEAEARGQ